MVSEVCNVLTVILVMHVYIHHKTTKGQNKCQCYHRKNRGVSLVMSGSRELMFFLNLKSFQTGTFKDAVYCVYCVLLPNRSALLPFFLFFSSLICWSCLDGSANPQWMIRLSMPALWNHLSDRRVVIKAAYSSRLALTLSHTEPISPLFPLDCCLSSCNRGGTNPSSSVCFTQVE